MRSWRAGGSAVLRPDCNGDLRTKTENVCWQVWMEKLESSLELPAADSGAYDLAELNTRK